MQKIFIKKQTLENGQVIYNVPAIPLKNSKNNVKLTIPHPTGTSVMQFSTIEEAVSAINSAGFSYVLPEGEDVPAQELLKQSKTTAKDDLGQLLYNKIAGKINDLNTNVVSSAIQALDNLNDQNAIDIFLEKMGEDNEAIRTAAIKGLAKYKNFVVDKLIDALSDSNWVKRNSAITCLLMISEIAEIEAEKVIIPMINRIDDSNPIVQANAILAVSKIYKNTSQ